MSDAGLPNSEVTIFLASLIVNLVMAGILFVLLGGRRLMGVRIDADDPDTLDEDLHRGGAVVPARGTGASAPTGTQALGVRRDQLLTLAAFVGVAGVALAFDKNIGFVSITAAVALAMLSPNEHKDAVKQIAWPTVLLVAGISTYATILRLAGLAGVRRQLGGRPRGRGARCAGALLRRRRGLGLRVLDRPAAGDHPDRAAADRRGRHQCRARSSPRSRCRPPSWT